jgi:hypothetical protein
MLARMQYLYRPMRIMTFTSTSLTSAPVRHFSSWGTQPPAPAVAAADISTPTPVTKPPVEL